MLGLFLDSTNLILHLFHLKGLFELHVFSKLLLYPRSVYVIDSLIRFLHLMKVITVLHLSITRGGSNGLLIYTYPLTLYRISDCKCFISVVLTILSLGLSLFSFATSLLQKFQSHLISFLLSWLILIIFWLWLTIFILVFLLFLVILRLRLWLRLFLLFLFLFFLVIIFFILL